MSKIVACTVNVFFSWSKSIRSALSSYYFKLKAYYIIKHNNLNKLFTETLMERYLFGHSLVNTLLKDIYLKYLKLKNFKKCYVLRLVGLFSGFVLFKIFNSQTI